MPTAFRAGVQDVLLAGLALALESWRRDRGVPADAPTLVAVKGTAVKNIAADLDLSRTVGWFTTRYPVRLDPGVADWTEVWAGGPALGRAVKAVKEQLHSLPDNGIGYGLLRYLNPDTGPKLSIVEPQVGFNYLGRFPVGQAAPWAGADETDAIVGGVDDDLPLSHAVEVNAVAEDHPDGLRLSAIWTYAGGLLAEAEVAALAGAWCRALTALVAHTAQPGAGGLSPSDVPLVSVGQDELDRLAARARRKIGLADVLPLTPVQELMLAHARHDPHGVDVYHVQAAVELSGPLRTVALRAAAQRLLQRHPVLRTAFPTGRPWQVVAERVDLPWVEVDLQGLDDEAQRERLSALKRRDCTRAASIPRTRHWSGPHLASLAPDQHVLVVTHHHLLLDGWSVGLVLRDLVALYGDGDEQPEPMPWRGHLAWRSTQDRAAARNAWRDELSGLDGPTLVAPDADPIGASALPEVVRVELPAATTAAVAAAARRVGLTLNTVIQGAWARLLAERTGRRDVVFGTMVSGRAPEIPGVEDMVGLLVNLVPVRVTVRPDEPLAPALTGLQDSQSALGPHHFLGLAEIERAAGTGRLFDTCVVFQNYPRGAGAVAEVGTLNVTGLDGIDAYHYPLKLMVVPGECLYLELSHRPEFVDASHAGALLDRLAALLAAFAADLPQT